ncbi:MAG: L-aspartate oxidase [Alphaproteobacteria bacterium RBG_16_64_48]|nr:MAG: L-aspartate oxidase [Alphaproteobacteria bacterium RBG_16_64_48]
MTSHSQFPSKGQSGTSGVVVVGAGLAGLFTALKLAPVPVTVVSAARFGEGASSLWAQAGIAAAIAEGDSPEAHAADTIRAGAGIVDPKIAHLLAGEARDRIADLLRYGVPFDKDLEGHFSLGREAAHGKNRILHVKGDTAGRAIMHALTAAVRQTPSITVLEGFAARDLVLRDGRIQGVELAPADDRPSARGFVLPASAVVLATGGAGQIFAITTNPREARGEGIAIAARAGATIADAEFVQFHPTAINIGRDPAPLATEALRGEGALLIDARGERFMRAVHEDAELGPRDIVARAVYREVASGRGAFLDCRPLGTKLAEHFPTVFAACRAAGIDPLREPIPVAPAAHYHMGGILTDARGRSTVDGLWACGEVASTGAHGANRLASNSLLEAVVFGARVAGDIASSSLPAIPKATAPREAQASAAAALGGESEAAEQRLRLTMAAEVGVIRDEGSLRNALATIDALEQETKDDRRLANMLTTAKLITAAALERKESRGAHFRSDYPTPDERLARRSFLTLAQAEAIAREARETLEPARRRHAALGRAALQA